MCRLECPANVDIPKLMLEAKAAYVRTNGLPLHDWLLARIDIAGRARRPAAGRSPIGRFANPQARWLLEKLIGIAQGRKLPRFARRSFLQQAAMRRLHHPPRTAGEKVVYFVDTYANYFDTQLAEALVAVLRHNGVAVYVPHGSAAGRHADDRAGRARAGPRRRRAKRGAAGRSGAPGLHDRRHRALGRAGADARVPDAARRRRRRAAGRRSTRRKPATICGSCISAAG